VKDFRSLKVWEKAHELTLAVYKATDLFPKQELYALTNQIQRAAVSIPTNIAEGCGKDSDAELKRYAYDLGYLSQEIYQNMQGQLVEVRKMLNASIQKLKRNSN